MQAQRAAHLFNYFLFWELYLFVCLPCFLLTACLRMRCLSSGIINNGQSTTDFTSLSCHAQGLKNRRRKWLAGRETKCAGLKCGVKLNAFFSLMLRRETRKLFAKSHIYMLCKNHTFHRCYIFLCLVNQLYSNLWIRLSRLDGDYSCCWPRLFTWKHSHVKFEPHWTMVIKIWTRFFKLNINSENHQPYLLIGKSNPLYETLKLI